jgi:hypothetical protein
LEGVEWWLMVRHFDLPCTVPPSPLWVMHDMTRFAQPCIHKDALFVLLSALYLYLLPRVLILRRMHMSGAGSSLFCALTVK